MSALPDRDRSGQARVDEPALVARALAGDRAALGMLVEAYAGSVRRITRAILGNVDDAEDAAQDGVLTALVKLDRYDPARTFGPWLLRIAANAAIDRRRRRSVRETRVLGDDLAAGGPLPDAETERLALGDRLRAALDELPEHYRVAGVGTLRAVLGRWCRFAIAAAVVLAFLGGYLAGRERDVATSFDTVWATSATGSEAAAELLATHRAPDPSALFASMLAN